MDDFKRPSAAIHLLYILIREVFGENSFRVIYGNVALLGALLGGSTDHDLTILQERDPRWRDLLILLIREDIHALSLRVVEAHA